MTFYHCYEQIAADIWREVRNPGREDGRWQAKTNQEAANLAREVLPSIPAVLGLGDSTRQIMAVAQHRVRTFPESLQDDRPFAVEPVASVGLPACTNDEDCVDPGICNDIGTCQQIGRHEG